MRKILIASFDLEVGGVERSLISMLDNFDYDNNEVDLMLYSHSGEFMKFLTPKVNLLKENTKYKTIRMPIIEVFKNKYFKIGLARVYSKFRSKVIAKERNIEDYGYIQMQYMWKNCIKYFSNCDKEYDVAISYLWPHYYIAEKVNAKVKIAWIHTDYSKIDTDINLDLEMWNKFNWIIAVSLECKNTFLKKYPTLERKVIVIENIVSPKLIKEQSKEKIDKFTFNKNYFNILSIGRFCDAKGFDNAIKAMKILKNEGFDNIRWYLIGYGGQEKLLKDLIVDNCLEDQFIILGKKINPYPYIKSCDLYVQPSRYEGKAVTVREAQILAKPVMITNYSTSKSQVENYLDGYICNLSIQGIVDGIKKLYKDKELRELLSENCSKINYFNKEELTKLYNIMDDCNTF